MKALLRLPLACALAAVLCAGSVSAQLTNAATEPRTALLIGVSGYDDTYFAPLQSPKLDAEKMEKQLRALGFEVVVLKNSKRRQMVEAIDSFGDKLAKRGGVGLFYYSGHGVQFEQQNYLVPIDTNIRTTRDLPEEAVAVQRVMNRMIDAKNRLNLVFLDACRNNGIPSEAKSSGNGLASMRGGSGLMVFFATMPGQVAFDSTDGSGSLFTTALLNHLPTPGVSIGDMMADVTQETETLSDKISNGREKQTPFSAGSLSGRFYFVPEGSAAANLPPPVARVVSPVDIPPVPVPATTAKNGDVFHGSPYAAYNDHSKEIITRRLQSKLSDTGFYLGVLDGKAGTEVRQALTEYQRTYNLTPSGELDSITLRSLKLDGIEEQRQATATPSSENTPKRAKRVVEHETTPAKPRTTITPAPIQPKNEDYDARFKRAAEEFEKRN